MMYTNNNRYLTLDLSTTNQLKGLGILLVIISHMKLKEIIDIPYLSWAGLMGVTIFLLVSGYGLTISYINNGLKNYINKRWGTVVLPYSIVTLLWILIDVFFRHIDYDIITLNLALVGLDYDRFVDPSMWYITYIIMWYSIFYCVFSLPFKNIFKVALMLYISYLMSFHYPQFAFLNKLQWQFKLYSFTFPIGILAGLYFVKLVEKFKKYISLILGILAIACFIIFAKLITPEITNLSLMILHITDLFWGIGIISIFILLQLIGLKSRCLELIGKYSYELYLVEFVFLFKYDVFKGFNIPIGLLIYLSLITLTSIFLKKFTTIIKKIIYEDGVRAMNF